MVDTPRSSDPNQIGRRRLNGAFFIELDRIETDADQPRKSIDRQHVAEMTASIREVGVLQPISVRYIPEVDRYRIIAGECRFTAARKAGLTEIPCWVRSPKEEQILLEQIIENWQRSDLNPFELADSLALVQDSNGYSQKDLVSITGKSKGEISKTMAVLDLAPEVQVIARQDTSGLISKSHLYAVARMVPQKQVETVQRISRDKLTVVDVERMLQRQTAASQRSGEQPRQRFKRTFRTAAAAVTFTFRSNTIDDEDVLQALHEIRRQISRDSSAE